MKYSPDALAALASIESAWRRGKLTRSQALEASREVKRNSSRPVDLPRLIRARRCRPCPVRAVAPRSALE